jgi:hypothetical protein
MTKGRIRKILDLVPLIIILVSAFVLFWKAFVSQETSLQWKHYLGFLFLPIIAIMFYKHHQWGVLTLGLTLLLGLAGVLSFSAAISIYTFTWTPFEARIPLFYGQPIFVLWLTIHFILSGRYYLGIGTKEYWEDIRNGIETP